MTGTSAWKSASGTPKPWLVGFLCLLIPLLPTYSIFPGPLKSNGSPTKLLGLLLFFLVLLGFVAGRREGTQSRLKPAVAIFTLYFLINLIIYGVGVTRLSSDTVSAAHTRVLLSLIASTGIGLYTVTRVKAGDRDFLLSCLAIGLTFNCAVALLHAQFNIDLRFIFEPPGFIRNLNPDDKNELAERLGALRAKGTSSHPIEFSVLAAASIPITIYFAKFAREKRVRVLAIVMTAVNALALVASISRSGVIALLSGLLIFVWAFRLKTLATGAAVGLITLLFTVVGTPGNVQALWDTVFNSSSDSSVLERIADYPKVSQTLRDNPLFGLGLGGAEPTEYGITDNQWLQQLVTGGGLGFLAMALISAAGFFGLSAALRLATTKRRRAQAYAIGAAFVAVLSSSLTFDLFAFQQAYFLFFLFIALLWVDVEIDEFAPRTSALITASR